MPYLVVYFANVMNISNKDTKFKTEKKQLVLFELLQGQKIFYLIRPTQANLSLYQRWMNSSTQSETFFGDQVLM
jgi:hypothetical protein